MLVLRVRDEDLEALNIGELNLSAPRFDNRPSDEESKETDIIATSGSFLLRFKFEHGLYRIFPTYSGQSRETTRMVFNHLVYAHLNV